MGRSKVNKLAKQSKKRTKQMMQEKPAQSDHESTPKRVRTRSVKRSILTNDPNGKLVESSPTHNEVMKENTQAQNNNVTVEMNNDLMNQVLMGDARAFHGKTSSASRSHKTPQVNNESVMGDGIVVTVHAPEGEFEDEEISSISSNDAGSENSDSDEHETFERHDVTQSTNSEVQFNQNRASRMESAAEIAERYKDNPNFLNLVKGMVKDSMAEEKRSWISEQGREKQTNKTNECIVNEHVLQVNPPMTPVGNSTNKQTGQIVKSPSDTTIYAPGLMKLNPGTQQSEIKTNNGQFIETMVSQFVESIRKGVSHSSEQPVEKILEGAEGLAQQPQPGTSKDSGNDRVKQV